MLHLRTAMARLLAALAFVLGPTDQQCHWSPLEKWFEQQPAQANAAFDK
jgi:hypothetical protein